MTKDRLARMIDDMQLSSTLAWLIDSAGASPDADRFLAELAAGPMNSPTTAVRLQSSARQRGGEFRNTRGCFFRDLDHKFVTAVKLDHFALGIVGGDRSLHVWAEQLVGLSRQNDERRRPDREVDVCPY